MTNNIELLDDIFDKELIVYEDVQGDKIYVKWDGEDFIIKVDNLNSEPINFIDNSMDNYYGKAIKHFETMDNRVKSLLPKRWWFCLEYFPEEVDIYSKNPLNNLVLSSIIKNNKSEYTVEEIEEYSRLMSVECLPFIYKGKLNEKAIEAIKYFLNTSTDDLEYIFGENNFAFFFYKILNPQLSHSFLMNNKFNDNLKKIILKVDDRDNSFELLNPLYDKISVQNKTEYLENYSLIITNFLNFCQTINFKDFKLSGEKRNDIYAFMICKLFNIYLIEVKEDILKFDFVVPEFFNRDKFRFNRELVLNKLTRQHLTNPKLNYIFKCIFFSFNQEIEKPFGVFTKGGIKLFNNFVNYLKTVIDEYLNKKGEEELQKHGLVNFSDYFDIKYDKDGEDKVYPSIYDEITKSEDKKKKKGGVFGKGIMK